MYDVIVLGGGPAGVTAALRARELGATVALVERDRMGGTCTNDGCVPTRVLAKAARLVRDAEQFNDYGLQGAVPTVDFGRLMARVRQTVEAIHEKKQLLDHLADAGVTTLVGEGAARFVDAHTMAVGDERVLRGRSIIICVGGHARRLPFPGGEHALTHSDVWGMTRLPRSVAIVGAAATGTQLATVFAAFGAEVTLLDAAPRLLGGEDDAVSYEMRAQFERRGIRVVTGIGGIERIERVDETMLRLVTGGEAAEQIEAETVILAVGWPGNVEALNPGAAGIETARSYIVVDDHLRTSVPHIYAAGDITGRMMLVQSGGYEARIAAENAVLGSDRGYDHHIVPHGGFTDPEYASVGLTEAAAREGHDVAVATVPYSDLDRAVIDGRTDGFCKVIVDRATRHILGAHVVGEQAVEVVQMVAAGMAAGMTVEQLAELELAYPTFTAIVGLAGRRLARAIGAVPLSPQWRVLRPLRAAEWELGSS